ncbi:hypothetical protein [Sphingosinicella sp. CPCC 101087]|uniref:hypothetical protein n=1 Tax=Sphingosinicella sp. CPCC 101087 TaxID=2497754 RepID=UPI0013EC1BD6|nr:hypothetical protein [Sphingosinicella sp. CPCC 101087]
MEELSGWGDTDAELEAGDWGGAQAEGGIWAPPLIRFIPHEVRGTGADLRLRGALLIMPGDGEEVDSWPRTVRNMLEAPDEVFLRVSVDPDGRQTPANSATLGASRLRFLTDFSQENVDKAMLVWRRLARGESDRISDRTLAILRTASAPSPAATPDEADARQNVASIVSEFLGPRAYQWRRDDQHRPFRLGARDTEGSALVAEGPCFVTATPSAMLESAFTALDTAQYLFSLDRPIVQASTGYTAQGRIPGHRAASPADEPHEPAPASLAVTAWSGTTNLFLGIDGGQSLTSRQGVPDPHLEFACGLVAGRGLAVAQQVAAEANDAWQEAGAANARRDAASAIAHPFHRYAMDPGPDSSLPSTLRDAIRAARQEQMEAARSSYMAGGFAPEASVRAETAAPRRRHSIEADVEQALAGVELELQRRNVSLTSLGEGLVNDIFARDLRVRLRRNRPAFQKLIAAHLLAARPDPEPETSGLIFPVTPETGAAYSLSASEAHQCLLAMKDADRRRLFGMLAYPTVARVMKLVVDVEFALDVLPEDVRSAVGSGRRARFFIAPRSNSAGEDVTYWTACELAPLGPDRWLFTTFDQVKGGIGQDQADHLFGTLNLNQSDGQGSRYFLTSLDVSGRAEQMIQKAEGDAANTRAGGDLELGDLPARTAGIALHDSARAQAVEGEIKASDDLRRRGEPNKKLFTKDLVTGYRVDVAVVSKRTQQWEWRSLTERDVSFPIPVGEEPLEPLIAAALAAIAEPAEIPALRRSLDAASVRPATRMVPASPVKLGQRSEAGEYLAIDTIMQWEIDPLGAPCTAGLNLHEDDVDETVDLALYPEFGLPGPPPTSGARDRRPPRMEFGRSYRFGLRCTYAGGVGLPLETARLVYEGVGTAPTAIPRQTVDAPYVLRRQERIAAPVAAILDPATVSRPGDALDTLVVRSGDDDLRTPLARRILYVPGLSLEQASCHPHPTKRARLALDELPAPAGRPIGGLFNVRWDPETGGLGIRKGDRLEWASAACNQEVPPPKTGPRRAAEPAPSPREERCIGVFSVERTDAQALLGRKAHYYPDPTARRMAFQLFTRGPDPMAVSEPLCVDIYDDGYFQDAPNIPSPRKEPGLPDLPGISNGWVACGYPFAMPIVLDVERASGDAGTELVLDGTGFLTAARRFHRLREGQNPPKGSVTVRRVRLRLSPGADFDLRCWCVPDADDLDLFAGFAAAQQMLARAGLRFRDQAFRNAILCRPVPEQAEILDLRVVHAVQTPLRPSWPRGGDSLQLLREEIAREKWPEKVGDVTRWSDRQELAAGMTWVGGTLSVDRQVSGNVTLEIRYEDQRDEPGARLATVGGRLAFEMAGIPPSRMPLSPRPLPDPRMEDVDLVTEGLKTEPLFSPSLDSRAYRLEVTPVTASKFAPLMSADTSSPRFVARGASTTVWAVATRRPDPMSFVEMLPAFVWERSLRAPRFVERHMAVRLQWRRSRLLGARAEDVARPAPGGWYSSGAGERFALLACPDGADPRKLGPLARHVSQWGADAIRESGDRPPWRLPLALFRGDPSARIRAGQWVPMYGASDREGIPIPREQGRSLDLLTIDPQYDSAQDLWYVDIDIDARAAAHGLAGAPMMRLGIARYQEHALERSGNVPGYPWCDLHVSTPDVIDFRLEPSRRVEIWQGRKVDGRWPVHVAVRGPLATVAGGADRLPEPLRSRFDAITGPRFKASLRREPKLLVDAIKSDADETVDVTTSLASQKQGDLIWEGTLYSRRDPRRAPYYVFLEETDLMLSAHGQEIVESGPRFMAKVAVPKV